MQQWTKRIELAIWLPLETRRRVHKDNFFWTSEYYVTLSLYENQGLSRSHGWMGSGEAPRRNLYPDTWSPRKFATNRRPFVNYAFKFRSLIFLERNRLINSLFLDLLGGGKDDLRFAIFLPSLLFVWIKLIEQREGYFERYSWRRTITWINYELFRG